MPSGLLFDCDSIGDNAIHSGLRLFQSLVDYYNLNTIIPETCLCEYFCTQYSSIFLELCVSNVPTSHQIPGPIPIILTTRQP
jgi:hypothetical protein